MVVDQLTKIWAVERLDESSISLIGDVLALRLTFNTGAAFSSFTDGGPLLGVIAVGVIGAVAFAMSRTRRWIDQIGLALILGGAVGNLVDRIFRGDGVLDGGVVDFIDLSFWPTFNVADSAITIGVVILIVSSLFVNRPGD